MRRRIVRFALMALVLPVAVRTADALADRLESESGATPATKLLRQGSGIGKKLVG
jgi:hypothetical protein